MRILSALGITFCCVAGFSYAATFNGRLMDAACYNTNKVATQESGHKTYKSITKTCAPTASTTNFAVRITSSPYEEYVGDTIKLDDSGNSQAASEIRSGELKTSGRGIVHVTVSGKLRGETLESASVKPSRRNSAGNRG
jgi:hypothetical protein